MQGGEICHMLYLGFQKWREREGVVYPHISVGEDTVPSSFPPIIFCKCHLILKAAGAIMAMMTNTAILFQALIQLAKTRSTIARQKR